MAIKVTSYNKVKVLGTAASRVYFHLKAETVRMEGKWSDASHLGLTRPSRSLLAASLIRSIRFKQVVPPLWCVRVNNQEIEQAMSKSGRHEFINQEVLLMNAVGIDVSKGKSTVAILRPFGEVVHLPFDVAHEDRKASCRERV